MVPTTRDVRILAFSEWIVILVLCFVIGMTFAAGIFSNKAVLLWRTAILDRHTAVAIEHLGKVLLEAETAIKVINGSTSEFCSQAEYGLLRRHFMQSRYLKAIGRLRDGHWHCSTVSGILQTPRPLFQTPLVVGERYNLYWPFPIVGDPQYNVLLVQSGETGVTVDLPMALAALPAEISQTVTLAGKVVAVSAGGPPHNVALVGDPFVNEAQVGTHKRSCIDGLPMCIALQMNDDAVHSTSVQAFLMTSLAGGVAGLLTGAFLIWILERRTRPSARVLRAIRSSTLHVVYQPICDLASRRVVGAEALIRVALTDIYPEGFIQIAEQHGFIAEVTEFVLLTVLTEAGALFDWRPEFRVTINVSPAELVDGSLFRLLERVWPTTLPRHRIGFEITERSGEDFKSLSSAVTHLRRIGHAVYIDDFGTGHSNLAQISGIAIDYLKLDRSFVLQLREQTAKACILPEIVAIAQRIGAGLVIEGIESEQDARFFEDSEHYTLGQGWLFGRPMPASELIARVKRQEIPLGKS